jgi:diguanylate cyclase (GGDEF)-like protein
MGTSTEMIDTAELDRLADENGCAVSVVDSQRREVFTSNNNSICKSLNPAPEFSNACDKYCGEAFGRANSTKEVIEYRCHAGLDCKAVVYTKDEQPLVAIIGRTFTDTDKYREATQRALSGDWSEQPANDFFDNVLISGSSRQLDQAAVALQKLTAKISAAKAPDPMPVAEPDPVEPQEGSRPTIDQHELGTVHQTVAGASTDLTPRLSDWRSFAGSLLKLEYDDAVEKTLAFLAHQFGFTSMLWLTRKGSRLENSAAFGKLKDRHVRLGMGAGDDRLLRALADGTAVEIGDRRKEEPLEGARTMTIFPIGVSASISSAIAVLDPISDKSISSDVARFCRSIGQQFEILRLRKEVDRGDQTTQAIRKFTESLKRADSDDFWMSLTQNAAEMLKAERSSLLVFNEESQRFQIKAIVGTGGNFVDDPAIGERVARHVFNSKRAIAVENIEKAGLLPAAVDRTYKTPSFLSSPISVGGRVIGVMSFADRACGKSFDKASLELFDAIAPQLAMAIDRAELKERAGQFQQLSVTDSLTGLLNRRYMEERLMEETKRSNRHGYPMSFMMLDVDEFKSYNDNYGHPAGDEALKIVGNVIRETLRSADVAARFGGEEFAVLLPQTTADEARIIADRIRANIEQTRFPERPVTISIGVSSCSADLCRDADLVSAADKALYGAKRGGRNRVLAFGENLLEIPAK